MTGYTVHTGSTEKFSTGWDNIFAKSRAEKPGKAAAGRTKPKKAARKRKA